MKIRKIKELNRDKINFFSRKNYLRLDKNERVSDFKANIIKKIKLSSFDLSAYPETGFVYKSLANYLNISKNNLLITPGSDFGYRICFEYFCRNYNKKIISLDPTFGMVEVYTKLYNIKKIKIGYDKNFNPNLKKLLKSIDSKISLIVLANPNSPTGTILKFEKMIEIIKKAKKFNIPVLIDEAYFGFYKFSFIKFVNKFSNLLILRTFSKSFGLAGLRIGYLVASKNIIKEISKYKPMYEINSIACKVANLLIKNPKIFKEYINKTNEGKKYLQKELTKLKIPYLKTYANFIHIGLGKFKKIVEKNLKRKKILARKGPGVIGYESYLRITLGPVSEMKKVVKVLKN